MSPVWPIGPWLSSTRSFATWWWTTPTSGIETWIAHLADDYFGFGPATVRYIPKGPGSWKYHALKTTAEVDLDDDVFPL